MKGCDIFCLCGLETGSFAALNMAGAEGESGEWVKTLSLSLPAGCSAAMRYTSLQLTHVLWRSVSHTLDCSVDWPWLIAAGLCIERRSQSLMFHLREKSTKMFPRWLCYKNEHMWCWVIPHAPRVCDAGRCVCVNLYIIVSTRPVRVHPVQPRVVADVAWTLSGVSGDTSSADLQSRLKTRLSRTLHLSSRLSGWAFH